MHTNMEKNWLLVKNDVEDTCSCTILSALSALAHWNNKVTNITSKLLWERVEKYFWKLIGVEGLWMI